MRRVGIVGAGRLAVAAIVLTLWSLSANLPGGHYLAAPTAVLGRLIAWTHSGVIVEHVFATLRLSILGFAAGCSAGVMLPLLLHPLPRVSAALEPYIVASAGIPKYAVVPLLILWLGIDDAPKLWLVGLLVFYPMFIAVLSGAREVDRRLLQAIRVFGADRAAIARLVIVPSMLPFVFAALRVALPRAVSATIVGEFLIASGGVGYLIESARQNVDVAGVYAGIAIATALVVAAAAMVPPIERRALRWKPTERPTVSVS